VFVCEWPHVWYRVAWLSCALYYCCLHDDDDSRKKNWNTLAFLLVSRMNMMRSTLLKMSTEIACNITVILRFCFYWRLLRFGQKASRCLVRKKRYLTCFSNFKPGIIDHGEFTDSDFGDNRQPETAIFHPNRKYLHLQRYLSKFQQQTWVFNLSKIDKSVLRPLHQWLTTGSSRRNRKYLLKVSKPI